jgi:hypothetical protein
LGAVVPVEPKGGGKPSDEKLSDEEWLEAGREIESKSIDPDVEMLAKFRQVDRV